MRLCTRYTGWRRRKLKGWRESKCLGCIYTQSLRIPTTATLEKWRTFHTFPFVAEYPSLPEWILKLSLWNSISISRKSVREYFAFLLSLSCLSRMGPPANRHPPSTPLQETGHSHSKEDWAGAAQWKWPQREKSPFTSASGSTNVSSRIPLRWTFRTTAHCGGDIYLWRFAVGSVEGSFSPSGNVFGRVTTPLFNVGTVSGHFSGNSGAGSYQSVAGNGTWRARKN